jgi:signal transduction histidine kinase
VVALALAVLAAWMTMRTNQDFARSEDRARYLETKATELERFAGLMAHDVLGPLGAVGVALQLTRELHHDERTAVLTSRAQRSLARVKLIVDSLLAFARAGARPSPAARSDATRVAGELLDEAAPEAKERGVSVELQAPGPVEVACDEGALASILSNLIGNALKHASKPGGPCRVTLRIQPLPGRARITVEDSGPGLPPEVMARIFEPYVRGPEARERGVGLGLAIVKRLVEAHGGAVGVDSQPGRGSSFWVELPRAAHAPPSGERAS